MMIRNKRKKNNCCTRSCVKRSLKRLFDAASLFYFKNEEALFDNVGQMGKPMISLLIESGGMFIYI
ncbi:hypothetical protein CHH80_03795 [Bacillus sp. 7504-2]|nr:hypothetical protein CHH80_03795 [Bacillus sp. 7504-2]